MKFWLATSNPNTAQSLLSFGIFSDIVTNPDAVAAAGKPEKQVFQELCSVSPGRVYAMLREGTPDAMKAQAEALIGIEWVRRALATFESAYAAIDQICPTSSTAAETVESSY